MGFSSQSNSAELTVGYAQGFEALASGIFASPLGSFAFEEVPPHGIVALCASPGMGKTTLLNQFLLARSRNGARSKYVDVGGFLPNEITRTLNDLLDWVGDGAPDNDVSVVAIDNYVPGDDIDVLEHVELFRKLTLLPCIVVISLCPEGEYFLERLGEATVYWSCDLRVQNVFEDDIWRDWTHGIPALVSAAERAVVSEPSSLMSDPGYQEAFVNQVLCNFRPGIIFEERQLRLAMILLGSGTREELDEVLTRVDEGVWRLLARDVPLFGVDLAADSFSCAGQGTTDGLNVSFRVLLDECRPWPELVTNCASLLAFRGDFARAAMVSKFCPRSSDRSKIALAWSSEFVNVGEVGEVFEAFCDLEAHDATVADVRMETACVLLAVGLDLEGRVSWGEATRWAARHGGTAALALACAAAMRRGSVSLDAVQAPESSFNNALRLHLHVWSLLSKGLLDEAYSALLEDSMRLEPHTVVAGLLAMDYMLVSVLVGIAPSKMERSAFARAGTFFERAELRPLLAAHEALLPAAQALAGRQQVDFSFETHHNRASRMGYTFVQGLYLLVLAVLDLRMGAPKRGHVRLLQARGIFTETGAEGLVKIVQLLFLATQYRMGERVTKPEVAACRGISRSMDRAITVFEAAASTKRRDRPVGSGRWGALGCPRDVHWLVNVLSGDCGSFSAKFREVMPPSWRDSVLRTVTEVDAPLEEGHEEPKRPIVVRGQVAAKQKVVPEVRQAPVPIEVSLLGGFEVRAKGVPIQTSRLERRRAKSLFVLLAAMPGHVAKRFTIMESIWPEYDYGTAMHYVYAATSVIRGELGMALDDDGVSLVVSDKSQGTIGFDEHNVRCDVDRFESAARKVLDSQGDDRLVAKLCREVENLYKGDMFVPPTDGMGLVETRARELRVLFADVMVAGSNAANNMGMSMLACRFARRAHEVDGLREDAIKALVESLCGAGRHVEAEACYEAFTSHVIDATRRPPSRLLREAVHDLLQGVARGGTGVVAKGELGGHVQIVEAHGEDQSGQLKFLL